MTPRASTLVLDALSQTLSSEKNNRSLVMPQLRVGDSVTEKRHDENETEKWAEGWLVKLSRLARRLAAARNTAVSFCRYATCAFVCLMYGHLDVCVFGRGMKVHGRKCYSHGKLKTQTGAQILKD